MLLKGEYVAAPTEVLIVAESRFQIDALQPLARDVVTAVLVQLERQDGHPGLEKAIPYVTQRLSTTTRSVHHATRWVPKEHSSGRKVARGNITSSLSKRMR